MALTRPRFGQLNTSVMAEADPITVLNQGASSANVDVGFLFNRANGLVSNVALYWNESTQSIVTAYTANTGATNSNISVTSYANLTVGNVLLVNGGIIGVVGNLTSGNINSTGAITTTGNISAQYVYGDASYMSGLAPTIQSYKFANVASDANGYYQSVTLSNFNPQSLPTGVSKSVSTTPVLLASFVTNTGYPNATALPTGTVTIRYETIKTSGPRAYTTYAEVYHRTVAGVEDLIATSDVTSSSTLNTVIQQQAFASIISSHLTDVSDRIVVKIYAYLLSSGTDTITLNFDDTTNAGMELPSFPASINNFIPYINATTDVDIGSHSLRSNTNVYGGNLQATSGIGSASTTTGALTVAGGAGITGNLYVGTNLVVTGNLTINGSTNTINNTTIETTEYVQTIDATTVRAVTIGNTGATLTGTVSTATQPNITSVGNLTSLSTAGIITSWGNIVAASGIASTGTTTGALVVKGGAGISGNISGNVAYGSQFALAGNVNTALTVTSLDTIATWQAVKTFNVIGIDSTVSGIHVKSDGTKAYILGQTNDRVYELTLSTPYDITTASNVGAISVSAQDGTARGVRFKSDGTKMYITGGTNTRVYEYTLSTPWQANTAANVGTFLLTPTVAAAYGIEFNSDGSKMYVGQTAGNITAFTLSTPWSVNSASYSSGLSTTSIETALYGFSFNSSGTQLMLYGGTSKSFHQYTLGTAYDITTASYVGRLRNDRYNQLNQISTIGMHWLDAQNYFYTTDYQADEIIQYQTNIGGVSLSSASSTRFANTVVMDGSLIAGNLYLAGNIVTSSTSGVSHYINGVTSIASLTATGTVTFNNTGSTISIGTSQTTGNTNIGGGSQTGNLNIGGSTANVTYWNWYGATATGNTKNIIIGTGGLAGSFSNIQIGPYTGTGNVYFQSATQVNISNTQTSTSTITGALTVAGGAGIAGNIYTSGNVLSSGYLQSTATTISDAGSNSFPVAVLIPGNNWGIYANAAGGFYRQVIGKDASNNILLGHTSASTSNGNINVNPGSNTNNGFNILHPVTTSPIFTVNATANTVVIANAQASTSTTTGALVVAGGTGIAGNVFAGNVLASGFFYANGTPFVSSSYGNVQMLANLASTAPTTIGNIYTTNGIYWANGAAYSTSTINPAIYFGKVTASTAPTLIDTLPVAGNNLVRWTTTSYDSVYNQYRSGTIDSVNNGTTVNYSDYGVLVSNVGTTVATFTSNITSGNINLWATGNTASVAVTFERVVLGSGTTGGYLTAGPAGAAGATGATGTIANTASWIVTTNTTAATSTTTGALQVAGGAGITGNVFAGNINSSGNVVATTYFVGNGSQLTGISSVRGWNIITSNITMSTNTGYFVDTTSGPKTLTLPASATLGDTIRINDLAGTFASNNLTVGANGNKIQGVAQDLSVTINQKSFGLVYSNSTYGWKLLEL